MMNWIGKIGVLLGAVLLNSNTVHAHVTVEPAQVVADSYQKLAFKVTHGCEGSATHTVVIHVPESLHGAKPMPKAGWAISMEIKPLAEPYRMHGRLVTEEVRAITWHGGPLANEYFDEFVIHARVSAQPGQVVVPVTQLCESGKLEWQETAPSEKERRMLESPAPVIEILPAAAPLEHQH